jgi:hypothetical protein
MTWNELAQKLVEAARNGQDMQETAHVYDLSFNGFIKIQSCEPCIDESGKESLAIVVS